jgi:hypothetical protein
MRSSRSHDAVVRVYDDAGNVIETHDTRAILKSGKLPQLMKSRTWISTTTYSKAYLAVAWEKRHELKDYKRRGFAQFVYLTISAHLEGVLAELLSKRCS